jgi:hypothetical protein
MMRFTEPYALCAGSGTDLKRAHAVSVIARNSVRLTRHETECSATPDILGWAYLDVRRLLQSRKRQ